MRKVLFIILFLTILSAGYSRDYYIKNADINATVLDNGVVEVSEALTFKFTGCYSVIYREIPFFSDDYLINFTGSSSENFIETLPSKKDYFVYEFNFIRQQCDKETTVLMHYFIGDAVDVYDDASRLQLQFWGADWTSVRYLKASISVPYNIIEYWIDNSPESGFASNNTHQVFYESMNVPANNWIETTIVFPPIHNSEFTVRHEGSLEEATRMAELFMKIKQTIEVLLAGVFIITPFIIFWLVYDKHGRELNIHYMGVYERSMPTNDSPAIVSALLKSHESGTPDIDAFVATIFDLARRKVMQIKGDEKNIILKVVNPRAELADYERKVLDFLLGYTDNNMEINWKSFRNKLSTKYNDSLKFQKVFKSFKEVVGSKFDKEDYFDSKGNKSFIKASIIYVIIAGILTLLVNAGSLIIILPLLFFTPFLIIFLNLNIKNNSVISFFIVFFALFYLPSFVWDLIMVLDSPLTIGVAIAYIIVIIMNCISRKVLGKWTEKGRNFEMKWNNFRKFLKDYSLLSEHPPQSIIIWEQFMVYAIVLGVADNVLKVMKLTVPNFENRSSFSVLYYHPHFYSSMRSGFYSSSMASRSGRSGFGGGMGGFGGGIGGGGGGAR